MSGSKLTILNEILKQKKAEIAPEMGDDGFFNLFSSEQVLKDFDLSYEELIDGIVEGGGDGGIDSIYTFINGELVEEDTDYLGLKKDIVIDLVIIQSKNANGFSEETINKFNASAIDLLNLSIDLDTIKATYKKELRKKVELFRNGYLRLASKFPKINIQYFYTTKAIEPHPNVERKVEPLIKSINGLISDTNITFHFIGVEELLALVRKKPIQVKSMTIEETPITTMDGGYVALVSLPSYYNFITEDNVLIKSFFDANVRDYQGNIEVNKAIKDTLNNPSVEDFWWLNNGVTITTSSASLASKSLVIQDPQIVNGLQSSYELYNFFRSGGNKNETRKILIRIIKPTDEKSRLKVIKATNSQTYVPIASLRATDEIHLNIEDYFLSKGFYYDRRKNYYKNINKPAEKIISIPYLSQIITAIVLREPDNARARPSTLIKNDDEYKKIFDREYDVDIYLQSFKILKKVEAALKIYTPELATSYIGDIKFHVAMFTSVKALTKLNYSANELKNINVEAISSGEVKSNIQEVVTVFESLGATNKIAKGTDFVVALKDRLAQLIAEDKENIKRASITKTKEIIPQVMPVPKASPKRKVK